jgi:hypothetical protein
MAMTDPAFQERLKNIKDEENKSLWNQIVEAITELINTLGITIPKGSILAGALKSSMDLINANQEVLTQEEVFFSDAEPISIPIKRLLVGLKTGITDFSKDAQALLNNPNPTLAEYQTVIDNYEYDLSADLPSEELRRNIETQLEDIKNSYDISGNVEVQKEKLAFSKLQNPEQFKRYPNSKSTDESLADSPINKELYEKYLLLCGK